MAYVDKINAGGELRNIHDTAGRQMIAPIELTSTATAAHAKGEYFIYNDTLYEATSAIAVGGTITPNTNCTAVPNGVSNEFGGEISQLKSAFTDNMILTGAEIGYYSKRFYVVANNAHSAANDQIICVMKPGESYYVAIDTDNTEDAISCQLQRIVEGSGTNLATVATNAGYNNAPSFTLSTSVELIGIYIPAQNHDVTYTVNIMRSDGYRRSIDQNELKNSLLNQSIKETNGGKADFSLYTDFVRGNLSQGNISLMANKNRVSGLSIMKFDDDLTVNIASGFRFAYNIFTDGVYQSDSGWKTGTHTIPANTEIKCMISRATEDTSENADIALFVGQVTFITALGSGLDTLNTLTKYKLQERAEHIDGIVTLDKDNFELGNISINPLGWTYTVSSRRVRTKENYDLELEVGDKIRIKDPSKASFYIGFQTTAETYGASGAWVTEWECNYGGKYAFVIKANPEVAQADTSYLLGLLEIVKYNNNQQNIKNLASHNPAIASANHRGMNRNAPENTLPAFQQSKRYGFDYVETDIVWTSDGVPVLLHDSTINRTARNADGTAISDEISIANITYEQALTYDFGIWKAAKWTGTRIPTFEQLLTLCKKQGIKVLAELKSFGYTSARLSTLIDMVKSYGAEDLVCWISFENSILDGIKNLDAKATLGYISATVTSQTINNAQALKTDTNKVILMSDSRSEETINLCKAANIPLWTYTINNANTMRSLPLYLCGVTSDLYPVNVVWSESAEE